MSTFWLLIITHLACAVGGYLLALHPDTAKGWLDALLAKLPKRGA
jgi:hypothetical protein